MKKLLFCCLFFAIANATSAQGHFTNCVAACIDKVSIVKDYSSRAKAEIQKNAVGNLEVYTVEISEMAITPKKKIRFKVAIKDASTRTLFLFSDQIYTEIAADKILTHCQAGDSIMLLTVDAEYALPHHEILVK